MGSNPRTGTTGDRVVVTVPAASAYLSVLRTTAAGLAARLDFTLDEIEDLRIAVDEACAVLLADALPGADLACEFILAADAIEVCVAVLTLSGSEPSRNTFAWTVLSALAGHVGSDVDADNRVSISMSKKRGSREASPGLA